MISPMPNDAATLNLFKNAVRCTRCNARFGECDCWLQVRATPEPAANQHCCSRPGAGPRECAEAKGSGRRCRCSCHRGQPQEYVS